MAKSLALAALLGLAWTPVAAPAAAPSHERIRALMSEDPAVRRRGARRLVADRAVGLVPGLVDAVFFTPKRHRESLFSALASLAGEDAGSDYYAWVELVGRRADLTPSAGYVAFKREQFARIDPAYLKILDPAAPARVRVEEIVFGGARLGGIPELDDPPAVAAGDAGLDDDELVFGVELGGAARAYPHRYLSWHEMANDTLGGEPIVLSYCTLCDSGVVYSARRSANGERLRFGSSGLLYRSNKLMFDRDGFSLWNQLTGEPVLGAAARAPAAPLERLASSVATWGEWRRWHPATTAVRLDSRFGERWGFVYEPGAADRKRAGVRFPVWRQSALLPRDEEVFGLLRPGGAKAWPLARLLDAGVLEDVVAGEPVVLVAEHGGRAVRAYARGRHQFRPGSIAGELLDASDRPWRATESALVPPPGAGEEPLARLPGINALWFGWYGLVPRTELGGIGPPSEERTPPPG